MVETTRGGVFHEIVYVSSAARPFGEADLSALLTKAREKNERLGVTGMLLYIGGNFMQLIEGPAEALDPLVDIIGRDSRHNGLTVIVRREIERRSFPDWSMGYRRLDSGDRKLEGFRELPSEPADFLRSERAQSLAAKLLHSFQTSNR